MKMFCNQCEQTFGGVGCTIQGVCGKDFQVAGLQDLLIYLIKEIAVLIEKDTSLRSPALDLFICQSLFATVTNVNFDPSRLEGLIKQAYQEKEKLSKGDWILADNRDALVAQAKQFVSKLEDGVDKDVVSLRETLLFGLKGMAAYADHALVLGYKDEEVFSFFYKGLAVLTDNTLSGEQLLNLIMEFGKVNLRCLELLDNAHVNHFGNPVPTKVFLCVKKGPAIVVSGHDLLDLEQLLIQTQGKGINIYTHGEMLPAHAYPQLKKYPHLAGHFGTAWQNQQKEFDAIPAVILFTTNCIQRPHDSYKDRVFTTGLVAWPDVKHISGDGKEKDFSLLIKQAISLGGFKEDNFEKEIVVGFAHHAVLSLADKIVEAVKTKKIRHFFLIGGCDGAKPGRNYYTDFAQKVPQDCVILTLACGKFRFNRLDFGNLGGFPRLLDCGQCNDAYSAIKIAQALSQAFNCSINELPLSIILSWYEQKAVCILLTLLSLGIKNIRLGPTLPAFVSKNVLSLLIEKFNLIPVTTPEQDLKTI